MNMSKSKLLSLLMAGTVSLSFAACGKKEKQTSMSENQFRQTVPRKTIKPGGTLTYAL